MESVLFLRCLNFRLPSFSLFYPTSNSIWRCKLRYAIDFHWEQTHFNTCTLFSWLQCSIMMTLPIFFFSILNPIFQVFFKEIFLYILETPSSSFEHKWMVIQALTRICAGLLTMFHIFKNVRKLSMQHSFILTEQCISCLYFAQQMHSV